MSNVEDNNADNENIKHHAANNNTMRESQEKNGSDEIILGAVSDTTATDLKNIFIAGAIPLEGSFSSLIDLAEVSRKAVGLNGTSDESGDGLALTNEVLEVASDPDGGMAVGDAGVRLVGSDSIAVNGSGVSVITDTGLGINTTVAGVGTIPNTNLGVGVDADGLKVIPYHGIEVTADGITVTPAPDGGMEVTAAGVGLKAGNGTIATDQGLTVITGEGVKVDANGVAINYGRGLGIESDQLILLNQTTYGAAFPSASNNGDIHHIRLEDLWEELPDKLNSATGGPFNIFADGNVFLAVFSSGEICTSRDNGRTWSGGHQFEHVYPLSPYAGFLKHGEAMVMFYADDNQVNAIVMYSISYGNQWGAINARPWKGNFSSSTLCGSYIYICNEHSGPAVYAAQGEEGLRVPIPWTMALAGEYPYVVTSTGRFMFSSTRDGANTAGSLDYGKTWFSGGVIPGGGDDVVQLVISDIGVTVARYGNNDYLAYSSDQGSTWANTQAGLNISNPLSGKIGCICAFGEIIYATGLNNTSGFYQIYVSTDGVNWGLMQASPSLPSAITGIARTKDSMIIVDDAGKAWRAYNEKYFYLDGSWHLDS